MIVDEDNSEPDPATWSLGTYKA